jgi:hypothetical protein
MKLIRYYSGKLIDHYASIPIGGEAVIVKPLKEQPPIGCKLYHDYGSELLFYKPAPNPDLTEIQPELFKTKYSFTIGSIIGMPKMWEHWIYGAGCFTGEIIKRSPVTVPNSAINLLFRVTGARVCLVQDVLPSEAWNAGFSYLKNDKHINPKYDRSIRFKDWYLARYPEGDWERDWVEITTVRRIEREKP